MNTERRLKQIERGKLAKERLGNNQGVKVSR